MWIKNPNNSLDEYKLKKPKELKFVISQEQFDELERSIEIFGKSKQGIAKAYIRLGPESFWRRSLSNNTILEENITTQPSSKLSSSSMSH